MPRSGRPGERRGFVAELEMLLLLHGQKGAIFFAEQNSIPEPNTGCWLYEHTLSGSNYAVIVDPRKPFNRRCPPRVLVHRIVCEAVHGAMSASQLTRHKCDNPPCVNPDHVEPGTHQDNSDDMVKRGRCADTKGEKNGRAVLSPTDVRYVRENFRRGYPYETQTYSLMFGVAESIIRRVVANTIWPDPDYTPATFRVMNQYDHPSYQRASA